MAETTRTGHWVPTRLPVQAGGRAPLRQLTVICLPGAGGRSLAEACEPLEEDPRMIGGFAVSVWSWARAAVTQSWR